MALSTINGWTAASLLPAFNVMASILRGETAGSGETPIFNPSRSPGPASAAAPPQIPAVLPAVQPNTPLIPPGSTSVAPSLIQKVLGTPGSTTPAQPKPNAAASPVVDINKANAVAMANGALVSPVKTQTNTPGWGASNPASSNQFISFTN